MSLANDIATNLRRLMDERRFDGPELATRVGVTKAAVYRWLDGEGMTIANLEACARELRVQPSTLVRKPSHDGRSEAV